MLLKILIPCVKKLLYDTKTVSINAYGFCSIYIYFQPPVESGNHNLLKNEAGTGTSSGTPN